MKIQKSFHIKYRDKSKTSSLLFFIFELDVFAKNICTPWVLDDIYIKCSKSPLTSFRLHCIKFYISVFEDNIDKVFQERYCEAIWKFKESLFHGCLLLIFFILLTWKDAIQLIQRSCSKFKTKLFENQNFYDLLSNWLRSNENNLIYFLKQLGNKRKRKFSASRPVFS